MPASGPPKTASSQTLPDVDADGFELASQDDAFTANSTDAFRSLLFGNRTAPSDIDSSTQPAFFGDLNLDQVVAAVVAGRSSYGLVPFFHARLTDLELVRYRQQIFIDLERTEVYEAAQWFAKQELVFGYTRQRQSLSKDDGGFAHYHYLRSFLNTAVKYCQTLEDFTERLGKSEVRSPGLVGLHRYLDAYLGGDAFGTLRDEAKALDADLDQVRYSLLLKGSRITVGPYDEQDDYGARVSVTFERFAQDPVDEDAQEFRDWESYSGLGVLNLVAKVHPELFQRLDDFCGQHGEYLDARVAAFDRELQFFLGFLDYIRPLRDAGLEFSYPTMSTDDKSEQALDTFDLALAAQRVGDGATVVCNDVTLDGPERTLVITGPNNGGKTTLARTVGQLHYLSGLGCPVAGRNTRLFLCDQIFTRFERREDSTALEGKLQDELNRLHQAFAVATPSSLFILNEMFGSTTAQDALLLSREILGRIGQLDCLCVCVTFLDELASLNTKTVSMVSGIDPQDPTVRTFRLVRREADGRAYARALAEKYGLTYAQLARRTDP